VFFDQEWAVTLVDRAVATLAGEETDAGRSGQFAILKPWLLGEVTSLSQADAAQRLGLSEGAVKVAIHRLRKNKSHRPPVTRLLHFYCTDEKTLENHW
jgi:RNA polymerase sigma-70 factor (ECF subfamily)